MRWPRILQLRRVRVHPRIQRRNLRVLEFEDQLHRPGQHKSGKAGVLGSWNLQVQSVRMRQLALWDVLRELAGQRESELALYFL